MVASYLGLFGVSSHTLLWRHTFTLIPAARAWRQIKYSTAEADRVGTAIGVTVCSEIYGTTKDLQQNAKTEVMWKCAFEISRQNLRQSQWSAYSLNVGHRDSCSALGTSQRTNVGPSLTRRGRKGRRPLSPQTMASYCAARRTLHQKDKPGQRPQRYI